MRKFAVVVAGGAGQRMGTETPKQFLLLKGKPLLHYTITAFLEAYDDMHIILVLPSSHLSKGEHLMNDLNARARCQLVTGGETRFHSVRNGLQHVTHPSIVFVHDGVRCLVTKELIRHCFGQAAINGSAIPAVVATESMRVVEEDDNHAIDRNQVRIIQTPQTFQSEILVNAYNQEFNPAFTDEATVVEASGTKVHLVEGDYNNVKITRPIDMYIAEILLSNTTS